MPSDTRHAAAIAHEFSRHLAGLGFSRRDIFRGTGLTPGHIAQDGSQAPLPDIARLFRRGVELSGNDLIALEWGWAHGIGRMGLLSYVGQTSATVHDVLFNIARFRPIFSASMRVDTQALAEDNSFTWRYTLTSAPGIDLFAEAQTSRILRAITQAFDADFRPRSVAFAHHRASGTKAFAETYGCPVVFDAPRYAINFAPADLRRPIPTSDPDLHRILVQHGEMVLAQIAPDTPDICQDVERALAERLSSGRAALDQVAGDLGMSPRTLARRLTSAGTTFHKVLARLRRALAEQYLRDRSMSQAEIAFLLGYADVSSFAAAYKRWTGRSPGAFRHALA